MAIRLPRRLAHGEAAELVDHLGELRTRLFVSIAALIIASAGAYIFHARLIRLLNGPLDGREPVTFSVAEPFMTSLKVSLCAGFLLALPVLLWQLWGFLAPAFESGRQRVIAMCVAASGLLMAIGVAFGFLVALPAAVSFLTNFDSDLYNVQVRASSYYSFALLVLLSVGVVFQLPLFVLTLVRLGVTSATRLRRNRRLGYLIVTVVAVALPGVDPVTTLFELVPLVALFEASIWLSVLMERRLERGSEVLPGAAHSTS